jgi:hypothetical protein
MVFAVGQELDRGRLLRVGGVAIGRLLLRGAGCRPLRQPARLARIARAERGINITFKANVWQDRVPLVLATHVAAHLGNFGIETALLEFVQMRKVSLQPPGPHKLRPNERRIQVAHDLVGLPAVPGKAERQQDCQRNAKPPAALPLQVGFTEHTLEGSVRHATLNCKVGCAIGPSAE